MNASEEQQQAPGAVQLTPEEEAQIEATAHQLATATPIPGITTDMLDAAGEIVNSGLEGLAAVAEVAAVVGTVVEVAAGVVGVVADIAGSIDLGGS